MTRFRLFRIIAVAVLLAGATHQARAEDPPSPEALQAANDLFGILSPDLTAQLTARITNAFWPMVEQKARADKIDDATIAELHREFERIQIDFLTAAMKDAPAIYARHFTVGELGELIAFYRTPVGAKALHEMPQVTAEFTTQLLPRLQDVQRRTSEAFNTILHAHGYVK